MATVDDIGVPGQPATNLTAWQAAVRDYLDLLPPGGGSAEAVLEGSWNYNATNHVGPPVAGGVRFNNANPGMATEMYISEFDRIGTDRSAEMDIADDSAPSVLLVRDANGAVARFNVPTPGVDHGAWRTTPLVPQAGNPISLRSTVWITVVVPSTGGGLPARTTATITTASLAADATETGTVALAPGYRLLRISTSVAARVRLYTSTAARTGDLSRPVGTDPVGDHGVMLDLVSTSGDLDWGLSPLVDGYTDDATATVPYAVTNLSGGAASVVVTLTWIATEGS